MIQSIAHPTDFSPEGQAAFEHALYLALANRCRLDLLHVHDPRADDEWDRFPHVRKTLQRWGLLPASGFVSPFVDVGASVKTTILPALTLSLGLAAVITRQTRSSFADVMQRAFIKTARAKGLHETKVILDHAFKNAMLPVVTILGIQLATLFSGAVITETIFAVPGIGRLLVDSILSRDYPVVQAVVLFISLMVVIANLAVDIAYGFLDPRIRET